MAKNPKHGPPPPAIFGGLPLEDMRELWYWGKWKELVPDEFSKNVTVICTSRQKCKNYAEVQTHDYFHDDDAPTETVVRGQIEEVCDDGTPARFGGTKRFRLVSFDQLVDELCEDLKWDPDITLIVNPGKTTAREFTADAIWHAETFLRRQRRSSVPTSERQRD